MTPKVCTLVGFADEAWGVYPRVCVTLGEAPAPYAAVVHQNVLAENPWVPDHENAAPGGRLIVWSGSLGEDLFDRAPETWLPEGMRRLDAWLGRALEACAVTNTELLLRPHARHVLCDAHRIASFLGDHPDVGLALAPVALLESDMLHDAEDHLIRALETLGERASCVLLQNLRPPERATDPPLRVPLGEGMLDPDRLVDLVLQHVPAETPLVLMGSGEQQRSQVALIASRG